MTEPADPLARIRALVEAEPASLAVHGADPGPLFRVCTALERAVPSSGAGMTMAVEGTPTLVLAASGAVAEQLEELQVTLGEGPCVDAIASRRPVLESDLVGSGARRWPAYASEAAVLGLRGVFSFPLQVGAACLGGMDLYRTQPGALSSRSLSEVLGFAEVALGLLLDSQQDGRYPPMQWSRGEGRMPDELYQAQGMVTVQLGVSPAEAMMRIRGYAFAQDRRLGEVAEDVVNGSLVLERDHP